ncbi:MAG: hypothetical protein WKF30_12385 [Pyrinomonadaceae bacterium]
MKPVSYLMICLWRGLKPSNGGVIILIGKGALSLRHAAPTIVPTAFAVRALVEAARLFNSEKYGAARRACDFILHDLQRSEEEEEEVCFSYSPLDRTRVFNAACSRRSPRHDGKFNP